MNYPFYPLFILFSCFCGEICLKLGQGLNFSKDRKRIKISEEWEVFVGLVNPTYRLFPHPLNVTIFL